MKGFNIHRHHPMAAGVVIFLVATLCGFGCATDRTARNASAQKADIDTLLVVPFVNQAALHGEDEIYRCALCGGMFETGAVEVGADTLITEKVLRMISAQTRIQVLSCDPLEAVRMKMQQDSIETPADLELVTRLGKSMGADAVLTGSVYRWIERAGSNYAADSPASVGFHIDLVDTKTGRLIWHTRVEETQDFLINNLFNIGTFLKRGGRWITADEMAAEGLKDVLERSPLP